MSRFAKRAVIPRPPIVSQRAALLPDGTIDPAATTDCGEACVASILSVASGFEISPGCVRQALGKPDDNGRTVPADLAGILTALGAEAWPVSMNVDTAWSQLGYSRHHGYLRIMLGYWLDFPSLHWVVAYERTSAGVWVMDPWNAEYRDIDRPQFARCYVGQMVSCRLS